ncbi:outer membrane protein [Helicobacter cetorum]|uniref:Outer membrane protein 8 n=1 Tax=Helicobacter cetorum (strain ATCC BAA-429 / MIT 00-7128) TaxID=182217 RepID=I0EM90_HELC0|nr:outer membrane protein [Helicobacter cetorum]AFI04059.1 outer membrane protein 8 [Helicobacter cetorum MIT 00-7128]
MNKTLIKISSSLAFLFSALSAEKSGFFLQGSYEVGQAYYNNKLIINGQTDFNRHQKQTTQGFGVGVGYNQLFGQSGWAGLRYYGFYDWAEVNFGTQHFPEGLLSKNGLNSNMNINTYGAGIDLLLNFVNLDKFSMGLFAGMAVGGTTWSPKAKNRDIVWNSALNEQQAKELMKGDYEDSVALKNTVFQWLFHFGVRSVISRYTGLELGFKIPMATTPYLNMTSGDDSYKETFKRMYSFNVSYYIIF